MSSGVGRAADASETADPAAVPQWLWLHLPIALIVFLHLAASAAPLFYEDVLIPEDGLIEWATPAILILAMVLARGALRRAPNRRTRVWVILFILGCLYFAGEEVSWGQRIFQWETPDTWRELNKQEETNIHNTLPIFDDVPRLLLSIGLLFGGVIYPLSARARRLFDRLLPAVFWPAILCTPAAIIALGVGMPENVARLFTDTPHALLVIQEPGEVKELFLAIVLAFYAVSLRGRLATHRGVSTE